MDTRTLTTPEVARVLGVSLPTAHRALDAYGVPRTGRGRTRTASEEVMAEILSRRGTAPRSERTPTELRVLAALSRSPLGLASVRAVASKAGISPTTASRALRKLALEGFAQQRDTMVASGRARQERRWFSSNKPLPTSVKNAMRHTRLVERTSTPRPLPSELHHLFWNANVADLNPQKDGSYLAERLLQAPDLRAWNWALTNLSRDDVEMALGRRGVDDRTRALARNWWAHEG